MDTLAISRRLREAGLEQPAAEAITSAIRDAADSHAASKARHGVDRLAQTLDLVEQRLARCIIVSGSVFTLLQIAARYILPAP